MYSTSRNGESEMKTGTADLPLHHGHVPSWLAGRMARLGRVVVEALVLEYGRDEVLRRLANPFWFQALGCVMGMDWHSSGIITSQGSCGVKKMAGSPTKTAEIRTRPPLRRDSPGLGGSPASELGWLALVALADQSDTPARPARAPEHQPAHRRAIGRRDECRPHGWGQR